MSGGHRCLAGARKAVALSAGTLQVLLCGLRLDQVAKGDPSSDGTNAAPAGSGATGSGRDSGGLGRWARGSCVPLGLSSPECQAWARSWLRISCPPVENGSRDSSGRCPQGIRPLPRNLLRAALGTTVWSGQTHFPSWLQMGHVTLARDTCSPLPSGLLLPSAGNSDRPHTSCDLRGVEGPPHSHVLRALPELPDSAERP